MTQFLTQNSRLPPYMMFPRFLMDKVNLNETAKILYVVLLDRARLSIKNEGWIDEYGHVFIFFPIKSLAEVMNKSEMSIKTGLYTLEKEGLILRKRQGAGFPNRIYVKIPSEYLAQTDENLSDGQTEDYMTDGQETVCQRERKLSGSNIKKSNNKKLNNESKEESIAYGFYKNVFMDEEERGALEKDVPNYQEYIEKLSNYMVSSGKRYSNHVETIRSWALRDQVTPVKRNYECREEESL